MATAPADLQLDSPRWSLAKSTADRLSAPYSAPPIPVLEIAEQSGVNVVFTEFDRHRDTVAGFCDFATARLYVNAEDPVNRQTFTMAHELGHWLLHREYFVAHPDLYSIFPRFQRPASNPFEKEANHFAANLLVPKRLLTPVKHGSVTALASAFGVSREMMEYRLQHA